VFSKKILAHNNLRFEYCCKKTNFCTKIISFKKNNCRKKLSDKTGNEYETNQGSKFAEVSPNVKSWFREK